MILLIDPPVTAWSLPDGIRAWLRELEAMRAQHTGGNEALACIARVEEHARSLGEHTADRSSRGVRWRLARIAKLERSAQQAVWLRPNRRLHVTVALAIVWTVATRHATAQEPNASAHDTSLVAALLRTAIREGLYTAHGADTPQLVCIGLSAGTPPGAGWLDRLVDPPNSVIAELQRGRRTIIVRPRSACRILPDDRGQPRTSRVEDTTTRKRGILVWVGTPAPLQGGRRSIEFGYHQHELSGGHWKCTLARRASRWEVTKCELLGIA